MVWVLFKKTVPRGHSLYEGHAALVLTTIAHFFSKIKAAESMR